MFDAATVPDLYEVGAHAIPACCCCASPAGVHGIRLLRAPAAAGMHAAPQPGRPGGSARLSWSIALLWAAHQVCSWSRESHCGRARRALQAYDSMRLDDEHIFTCVGTSGPEAPPVPPRTPQRQQQKVQVESGKVSGGPSQVPPPRNPLSGRCPDCGALSSNGPQRLPALLLCPCTCGPTPRRLRPGLLTTWSSAGLPADSDCHGGRAAGGRAGHQPGAAEEAGGGPPRLWRQVPAAEPAAKAAVSWLGALQPQSASVPTSMLGSAACACYRLVRLHQAAQRLCRAVDDRWLAPAGG